MVDQLATAMGKDPLQFRREFLSDDRVLAVLDKVAEVGDWGRTMPPGTAQGIALHKEYKGATRLPGRDRLPAGDGEPQDPRRRAPARGSPRWCIAVDVGLPINPRGLEAQMMGGIMDGIALALTSSLHLQRRPLPRGQLGQLLLHAAVEHRRPTCR